MKEIFIIGADLLILSAFAGLIAFYVFVLWHWRKDSKRRALGRQNWPSSIANSRPVK
jgi:hypothetical protein